MDGDGDAAATARGEGGPPVVETDGQSSPRAAAVAASPSPSTALPGGRCGVASSAARPSMPCIWGNGSQRFNLSQTMETSRPDTMTISVFTKILLHVVSYPS